MDDKLKAINFDPYALLGVDEVATKETIHKAYLKATLKVHPDKRPRHMKEVAEKQFHRLSRAYKFLSDDQARATYDRKRRAKRAAAKRNSELDSKRRKFKEDLKAREATSSQKYEQQRAKADLQVEIERLQKEGEELLRQEQEKYRQQQEKYREAIKAAQAFQKAKERAEAEGRKILQVIWRSETGKPDYNHEILREIFQCYEKNVGIKISRDCWGIGKAFIEFSNPFKGEYTIEVEKGRAGYPKLELSWFVIGFQDFENIVLTKMERAEEQKHQMRQTLG